MSYDFLTYDFGHAKQANYAMPSFKTIMASIHHQLKGWVHREVIDFDPDDEEVALLDLPEDLRTGK